MNTQGSIRGLDRAEERGEVVALLVELNELEEETYRLALAHASYIEHTNGRSAPIRALVAHANGSLDDLRSLAGRRRIRLGSANAIVVDTIRRIASAASRALASGLTLDPAIVTRAESDLSQALGRGAALGRRIQHAAQEAGDEEIVRWSRRWLRARTTLVEDAYIEGAFEPADFRLPYRFGMAAE